MTPETNPIQFPRQIWQTVSELARNCLVEHSFCPEQSRIENLRCVRFDSEKEAKYGAQLWYFEAIGVDVANRRHMLFGALDFSVQYGILEPIQAVVFEESDDRQNRFNAEPSESDRENWNRATTKFWVRTACAGVCVSAAMWFMMVYLYFAGR